MKLDDVLNQKRLSKCKVAMMSGIMPSDFYQALNGKKPFFPAWRKRVSEALNMPESELFPEYEKKEA